MLYNAGFSSRWAAKRSIAAKPHEVRSITLEFEPKTPHAHLRREVFP